MKASEINKLDETETPHIKVYIAGPWARKDEAEKAAVVFERAGYIVARPWWFFEEDGTDAMKEELAIADVVGVINADCVVVLNLEKSEGKAVETGITIALGKPLIVVGERSNIFHWLPGVILVDSVEKALEVADGIDYTPIPEEAVVG